MKHIHNQSLRGLTESLLQHLQENGYSEQTMSTYTGYAKLLSKFMMQKGYKTYDDLVGEGFFNELKQSHAKSTIVKVRLFIERLNALQHGKGLLPHIEPAKSPELPTGLNMLLLNHKHKCIEKGLRFSSVQTHERYCQEFLWLLAAEGIEDSDGFTTAAISKACLHFSSKSCFSVVRLFLRYIFDEGMSDRDYSVIVPRFRAPQPMPSVYTVEELRQIESAIDRRSITGKRNYAIVLLVTRLGIRSGDIATMTMNNLDFQSEKLHFIQQKTGVPIMLPIIPKLRDALMDYIHNARETVTHEYVFLSRHPPYANLSTTTIGNCIRYAIRAAHIDTRQRQQGPRAIRSSVASAMVNDNISYEVVRRTLGHTGKNAIKSYAKLDVEQLKLYTLEPPAATGRFAEFLAGRWS